MGHTPYGYRIDNGQAVIDEEQAAAVRKLLESYLGGMGFSAAVEAAGLHVTHTQAKRMLTNEKYLGTDYYPAIITKEEMEAVIAEKDKRARALGRIRAPKEPGPKKKPAFIFSMPHVDRRHDDPYRQAAYAFSLIEEVQING